MVTVTNDESRHIWIGLWCGYLICLVFGFIFILIVLLVAISLDWGNGISNSDKAFLTLFSALGLSFVGTLRYLYLDGSTLVVKRRFLFFFAKDQRFPLSGFHKICIRQESYAHHEPIGDINSSKSTFYGFGVYLLGRAGEKDFDIGQYFIGRSRGIRGFNNAVKFSKKISGLTGFQIEDQAKTPHVHS